LDPTLALAILAVLTLAVLGYLAATGDGGAP
jgi:hypothetical protein